jgi:hypothetical protein
MCTMSTNTIGTARAAEFKKIRKRTKAMNRGRRPPGTRTGKLMPSLASPDPVLEP